MPFKCTKCGYGEANNPNGGVPMTCPICKEDFTYIRIDWDEYCKLEITDGIDKS